MFLRTARFVTLLSITAGFELAAQVDPARLSGIRARGIGPAGRSGRIGAIDVVVADQAIMYVGAATGGVWKTTDGAVTWMPVFDDQPVASIGAVAIYQRNPEIVWVGTGEGNPRNSAGVGTGVFRTVDGGKTWMHVGLSKSERISRIVLDPANSEVAYVAALGPAWSEGGERGVYRTEDGGKSWTRLLWVNERTGAADLTIDPADPRRMFAAMWEYRRWPWFFKSGGPGSGLYFTTDGGATWRRLGPETGMPPGELGRIGVAIAPSNPRVVYATVEAKPSVFVRSADGGASWQVMNDGPGIAVRPEYYADIRVHPREENRVYNLQIQLELSEDGGKRFNRLTRGGVHADHQALWIDPVEGRFMVLGSDGGVYLSHNAGRTWGFVANLPISQFYHIAVDRETPYNVYGGLQDNGSWRGPGLVWSVGGIRNREWIPVGFGDGFTTVPDQADPRFGYALWQGGFPIRFDIETGERRDVRPVGPVGVDLRFNWNAGFAVDPFDSATIYLGSQFVHRSDDRGRTWTIVSPDLTTNDSARQRQRESGGLTLNLNIAESRFTTIVKIAPSPVGRGVLWVGTDDGNVQVTRDAGATWENVAPRAPGLPAGAWVSDIFPSRTERGAALIAFDDHRRGDWTPYLYRVADHGRQWTRLGLDRGVGYVHSVVQDPEEPRLVFAGTEFGLHLSFDGGARWTRWTHGVPTVGVYGLAIQPDYGDLVVGTHGRSAYVLDDLSPLRALTRQATLLDRKLHLFPVGLARQYRARPSNGENGYTGDGVFRGENRPYGALITYSLGTKPRDTVTTFEVLDSAGRVLRKMTGPTRPGLNRVAWDLRLDPFPLPTEPEPDVLLEQGAEVPPGRYLIRVSVDGDSATAPVEVRGDPRFRISPADRAVRFRTVLRAGRAQSAGSEAVNRLGELARALRGMVAGAPAQAGWVREARRLAHAVDSLSELLISPPGKRLWGAERAIEAINMVYASLSSSWDLPSATQLTALERVERRLGTILAGYDRLAARDVPRLRNRLDPTKRRSLPEIAPLNWRPDQASERTEPEPGRR